MEFYQSCTSLKEWLAAEMQGAQNPARREEVLIDALYELSRSVLPLLGHPRNSQEYLEKQEAALDLISSIVIPLIKGAEQRRGVAVLSEIAEGCQDQLLRKKLLVYSHELLEKCNRAVNRRPVWSRRRALWGGAGSAVAIITVYLALQFSSEEPNPEAGRQSPSPRNPTSLASQNIATPLGFNPSGYAPGNTMMAPSAQEGKEEARGAERAAPEAGPLLPGETRVKLVNNQVLVPVVLKNGGETVKLELVMDTGATRTAIHEYLAGKLRVDLRSAKLSQAELADGRMISSRVAKIDAVVVGPYAMTSADLELIPYKGSDGLHDGLLGMDFLGKHRYQLDLEREVIRWF